MDFESIFGDEITQPSRQTEAKENPLYAAVSQDLSDFQYIEKEKKLKFIPPFCDKPHVQETKEKSKMNYMTMTNRINLKTNQIISPLKSNIHSTNISHKKLTDGNKDTSYYKVSSHNDDSALFNGGTVSRKEAMRRVAPVSPIKRPVINDSVTPDAPSAPPQQFDLTNTPQPLVILAGPHPTHKSLPVMQLRSAREIQRYQRIFPFPYFNVVQSKVFDDVMYTDKALVLCAPTGSGKTVIFELAIVRLLTQSEHSRNLIRIVYLAPIKALCSERFEDWRGKFEQYGLQCLELTGDTDVDDNFDLQNVNIVFTTPEKWDSMTRKWRDNRSFVHLVTLFLIDEIHVLNDDTRGATIEAVISRMKTMQGAAASTPSASSMNLRFIAVSATIPNVEDIAAWLGKNESMARYHKNPPEMEESMPNTAMSEGRDLYITTPQCLPRHPWAEGLNGKVLCGSLDRLDESYRPVRLRKVVLGFPCSDATSDYKFDIGLGYKLPNIINTYSDQKPTLVFSSTRKGVQQTASLLVKETAFPMGVDTKAKLRECSLRVKDNKLKDLVLRGVGYHHAGMDLHDRKLVENVFAGGDLPVLVATSTLCMGVNLPAHLVVIKSTSHYVMGCNQEYSDTQILQMIGRAGRPQFDTSATAVILTKTSTKAKYEALIGGTQNIESSLHKHLIEHLNAEIVLGTISNISVALGWLRSTFLYIRVMKMPQHYGL